MGNVLIEENNFTSIANAIRIKRGTSNQLLVSEMATEISNIQTYKPETTFAIVPTIASQTVNPPTGSVFSNGTVDAFYSSIGTASAMDALLTSSNIGKLFRYIGVTSTNYVQGRFYLVSNGPADTLTGTWTMNDTLDTTSLFDGEIEVVGTKHITSTKGDASWLFVKTGDSSHQADYCVDGTNYPWYAWNRLYNDIKQITISGCDEIEDLNHWLTFFNSNGTSSAGALVFKEYIALPTESINILNTNAVDVTNYAIAQVVDVNLTAENIAKDITILGITGTHSGAKQEETFDVTPTTSVQSITPSSGCVFSSGTVRAMPTGTLGTVSATKGTVSNNSISVTPQVAAGTAGYNAMAAYNGDAVTVSASELVSGTASITSTTKIDVTNNQYAQINDANLIAANIAKNISILGITGSYSQIDTVTSIPTTKATDIIYNSTDNTYYIWKTLTITSLLNTSWQLSLNAERSTGSIVYDVSGITSSYYTPVFANFRAPLWKPTANKDLGYYTCTELTPSETQIVSYKGLALFRVGSSPSYATSWLYQSAESGNWYASCWSDNAQTITFTDGTDLTNATLIEWLQTNATCVQGNGKYIKLMETPDAVLTTTPKVIDQSTNVLNYQTNLVKSLYEEVDTSTTMDSLKINTNVGKVYKYTGTSTNEYINGRLYLCQNSEYNITTLLTNCSGLSSNPTSINLDGTATLIFEASTSSRIYKLPTSITVIGATYSWDATTGTLILSEPCSDIIITIIGELNSLANTTWTLNKNLTPSPMGVYNTYWINYTTNSQSFTTFYAPLAWNQDATMVYYKVFNNIYYGRHMHWDGWGYYKNGSLYSSDSYRTIAITDGTDVANQTLLAWFQANATLVN